MKFVFALTFLAFAGVNTHADPFPDPPKKPNGVTMFWCGANNQNCEITCTIGGVEKKFTKLNAARVQTYPGSDKLWLETSLGPNSIILLGDALCDFSKMPIARPLN
jgi:hypothetical protein